MSLFDLAIRGIFLHNLERGLLPALSSKLADNVEISNAQILAKNTKYGQAIELSSKRGAGCYLKLKGYF